MLKFVLATKGKKEVITLKVAVFSIIIIYYLNFKKKTTTTVAPNRIGFISKHAPIN